NLGPKAGRPMTTIAPPTSPSRLSLEYYEKSAVYAYALTLARILLFIAALYGVRFVHVFWSGALLFAVIGFFQYQLYFPLHDCAHASLFRSRLENQFFGVLTAGVLFTSFENFRLEHMKHHDVYGTQDDPGAPDYWVHFGSRWDMVIFLLSPLWGGT